MVTTPPAALSIAGSDSGGGAGAQADLKTFAALGVFGTTAITALTAQNTIGVQRVLPTPVDMVSAQIDSVLADIPVRAVKTGMLAEASIIEMVAEKAKRGLLANLVVDPVMVSSSGHRLLEPEAEKLYTELLFPQALIITPNLREASLLTGEAIRDVAGMVSAARHLFEQGEPQFVLIKGGHLSDAPVDVMYDGERLWELDGQRIVTSNTHGSGCSLAAAIAAMLAKGEDVPHSVEMAKQYVEGAIYAVARDG